MKFYVGLHMINHAWRFKKAFISVNVLRSRRSDFNVQDWILDSGAFTEVTKYGDYRSPPAEYAEQIRRWAACGNLELAVTQDYMCEPFVLKKAGRTVEQHQQMSVTRFKRLREHDLPVPIMPVLQGWQRDDYLRHLDLYGDLIEDGSRVGVGSVCKRNSKPQVIYEIMSAINRHRPGLRLHGFGIKLTSIKDPRVRAELHSSDSMAWSFNARAEGRGKDANRWTEALAYYTKVYGVIHS